MRAVRTTTPFHPRLSELNDQGLYTHWQGTLSPLRYTHAPKHEYFAVRNSVGVFDTSPLYKYVVTGPDAERLLAGALVRDITTCRPGQAQYTAWCDDRGFVMHDGVVFRHSADEFLLTAARPALSWFEELGAGLRVELEDVTDDYGMLAVQGPRSRAVLASLIPEAESLAYFDHVPAKVGGAAVTLSPHRLHRRPRLRADRARGRGGRRARRRARGRAATTASGPFGEEALMTLRIEAGLALIDVEWHDAGWRSATPTGSRPRSSASAGCCAASATASRRFVGSEAIRRELVDGTSRWATTGIVVDWADWDRLYRDAGLFPPKSEHPLPYESMILDDDRNEVGYCTSFVYSPVLQRHIGIARVRPDLAAEGTDLRLELADRPPQHDGADRTTRRCRSSTLPGRRTGRRHELPRVRRHRRRRRPQRADPRGVPRPRPGCARWCWRRTTWSAAPRSPRSWCPASRSRRSPTR